MWGRRRSHVTVLHRGQQQEADTHHLGRMSKKVDAKKVYLTIIKILGWIILFFSVIVIIFGDSIYFLFNNEKQNSNMDYAESGIKIFEFGLLLIITSKVFKE